MEEESLDELLHPKCCNWLLLQEQFFSRGDKRRTSSIQLFTLGRYLSFYMQFFFPSWAPDTKQSIFVIQDLFEAISSGKKSSRALAGELLQIMTCNLVNTLKHKDPNVGIRTFHMWPCALPPPPPLKSSQRLSRTQLAHTVGLRAKITWM